MAERQMPNSELDPNLPSNSNVSKQKQATEQQNSTGITVANAPAENKDSISVKIKKAFFGADIQDVGSYLLKEVLLPALKKTLVDGIQQSASMLFLGQPKSNSTYSQPTYSNYTSYSNYSKPQAQPNSYTSYTYTPANRVRSSMYNLGDIQFPTKQTAIDKLDQLNLRVDENGFATVNDFLEDCGLQTGTEDALYGWDSRIRADIFLASDGKYHVAFPQTKRVIH